MHEVWFQNQDRDPWQVCHASCRLLQSLFNTRESFSVTLIINHGNQQPKVCIFDKELVSIDGDISEIMLMEANPW
jgi:hypothetical protein